MGKGTDKKKKDPSWLKPVPPNVALMKVTLTFKLADADMGKSDAIKVDDDLNIIFISLASFFNGLILGDKLVKVNGVTGKKCVAELLKGEASVEVLRRNGIQPAIKERAVKSAGALKRGHAVFILDVKRPANMTTTLVGLKVSLAKKRAYVVKVEPNSIATPFFGRGDAIIDMDCAPIPFLLGNNTDDFIREHLARLSTGGKVSFLVERPAVPDQAGEWGRFIESITNEDVDTEMPKDAIEIGREASNMHFIVLKKLTTPSILSADVKKPKRQNNRTSDGAESSISISTASTEMKILSDVGDDIELKPVVKKSHAAGTGESDGAFDDE